MGRVPGMNDCEQALLEHARAMAYDLNLVLDRSLTVQRCGVVWSRRVGLGRIVAGFENRVLVERIFGVGPGVRSRVTIQKQGLQMTLNTETP